MGVTVQLIKEAHQPNSLQIMAVRGVQNGKMVARLLSRIGAQQKNAVVLSTKQNANDQDQEQRSQGASWGAFGVGLLGAGLAFTAPLLADEGKKKVFGKTQADRVRQYATADNVFDHFAGYQVVKDTGKKVTMMSTRNFYTAMTPGSHIGEDVMVGKSAYKQLAPSELLNSDLVKANKMPVAHGSLLNTINEHGLLTYTDFHFLLLLMSTPTRYLDIIFHGFDISADGSVEAREFVHVLAKIANTKVDPELQMQEAANSGLIRYLFKDDLSGALTKADFIKLQSDLIDDVLQMEFTRYCASIQDKMSEVDFCRHLLYSAPLSQRKKDKMIKMVQKEFPDGGGISFEAFKTFYNVLFGGADLERAMYFLDSEKQGVTRDEFNNIANWVVGTEVDRHVVEVLYCLLDEDGDRNLSSREFNPVLFSWRHSRGFQNGSLSVTLGNMKF